MSYRRRLLITVIFISLSVIILAVFSAYHSHRRYREHAEITTQNLARVLESNLVNAIRRVDVSLQALLDIHAMSYAAHLQDSGLLIARMERIRARLPEVDAIRITDAEGMLILGNDVVPDARVSLADRAHFKRLRDEPAAELVISRPQVSRINGKWVIVLARRVTRADGSFDGMIFAAVALDSLVQQFATLDLGPGGAVALRDAEQRLIARHPDLQTIGLDVGQKSSPPELEALFAAEVTAGSYFTLTGTGNQPRTVAFRKLGDYPLYITVGMSATDYLAPWQADTLRLAVVVLLFLLSLLYAARIQWHAWQRQQADHERIRQQEALYHELVEDAPVLVTRHCPDTTITFANQAFADLFATTPALLVGKRLIDFVSDATERAAALERVARLTPQQPVAAGSLHRIVGQDGLVRWLQWSDRAFFDDAGQMTHLQSVGEDITERKHTRDVQAARLRLMEFASDHSLQTLLIATLDEARTLTESPLGFFHFLEADEKTLSLQASSGGTTQDSCEVEGEGRHYDVDAAGIWIEAIQQRAPIVHNDCAALLGKRELPPGHAKIMREMVTPVFRKDKIVAILGVSNKPAPYTENDLQTVAELADLAWDIAENKRLEAELIEMATTDFLTGLINRRSFMTRINGELERIKRFDIPQAAVLMLDLDHFKQINDTHGHTVGDAVLRHFAARLRDELRKIDMVGRMGGEEFAILLIGADMAAAEQFAERLRKTVATTPLLHEGQAIPVTVSIGIAALNASDSNAEAALSHADTALYEAKHRGRNRTCVYAQ